MGVEKGLMLFDGKPLVQRALETLSDVAGEVFVSANIPDYNQFSKPIIPDIFRADPIEVIRVSFNPQPNTISFSRAIHLLFRPNCFAI